MAWCRPQIGIKHYCSPYQGTITEWTTFPGKCSTVQTFPGKDVYKQIGNCENHRMVNTRQYPFYTPEEGITITTNQVNSLRSAIIQEIENRNSHVWPLSDIHNNNYQRTEKLDNVTQSSVKKGSLVEADYVAKLEEFANILHKIKDDKPKKGDKTLHNNIMNMQNEVQAAINDCICYSDCGAYYYCNCHGYCNNY